MELKITKEKVLAAASKCSDAKNILQTLFPEVFAGNYASEKIYAFVSGHDIYKLHHSNGRYSFIHIGSSECHANGYCDTAEDLLARNKGCEIFDNQNEFFKWAISVCK